MAMRWKALKKNTTESQEAFDLRKLIVEQQVDNFGQLFAETASIEMGWTTNSAEKLGHGISHWTALPNTDFAKWVEKLKTQKEIAMINNEAKLLLQNEDAKVEGLFKGMDMATAQQTALSQPAQPPVTPAAPPGPPQP